MAETWDSIPEELKWTNQWCLAGPDRKGGFKAPYQINGHRADTTKPETWADFDSVCDAALNRGWGIGFILSENDPYSVIDLDVKDVENAPDKPEKWTKPEDFERYSSIVRNVGSFTEVSSSGKGAHIWVRGNIGKGRRRDGVEIYSQERFMVCTGRVWHDIAIEDRQTILAAMASQMGMADEDEELSVWVNAEETKSDDALCAQLAAQENGAKFMQLCTGDWQSMGYESQSEADLSLMSMFAFVSDNDTQCIRLFRKFPLGFREKATRNDKYLTRWCLEPIRRRITAERAAMAHGAAMAAAMMQGADGLISAINAGELNLIAPPIVQETYVPPEEVDTSTIPWPPGRAGHLCHALYINAPRPVPEVSIVSVLGLLAGISGRNYQFGRSGLNGYFVLIGKSAIGKEALHSGISQVVHDMQGVNPNITGFVDFTGYSSGQALIKAVSEKNAFVNVSGEWGRRLKRLALEDGKDGPMQSLRTAMTDLYQKSSANTIVGGLGYSDKEKNVASVKGVAYSMIGESTPTTYNESLTETMMEDGFLSRFVAISYNGERPALNTQPHTPIPKWLLDSLGYMVHTAMGDAFVEVAIMPDAKQVLDEFNIECDDHIRENPDDDGWRQMWNRAHLKVSRIAATLAVFETPQNPIIDLHQVEWSLLVIRRDVANMHRQMDGGDIGVGDLPRERKLIKCCEDYRNMKKIPASYNVSPLMHKAGVVTRSYLHIRVQKVGAFVQHKMGFNRALEETIKALCDNGHLKEVLPAKSMSEFNFGGKCYYILAPRK